MSFNSLCKSVKDKLQSDLILNVCLPANRLVLSTTVNILHARKERCPKANVPASPAGLSGDPQWLLYHHLGAVPLPALALGVQGHPCQQGWSPTPPLDEASHSISTAQTDNLQGGWVDFSAQGTVMGLCCISKLLACRKSMYFLHGALNGIFFPHSWRVDC